ncbi:MAG: DUF937 domain-containing protein [Ginsengibacter sp.]
MSFNLLETVKNYFTSDFTNQSSSILGENVSGISKALTAIIPTALAGILNKSTSGTEGANKVFETAKNSIENVSENTTLSSVDNKEKGNKMLNNFFGSAQTDLLGNISKYAAIKDSSTSALMSMALPPILGILGKHAEQNTFSASGLAGFLSSQKDHIMQAMPAGLTSNAALLGLGSIGSEAPSVASNVKSPEIKSPVEEVHTISETPTAKWLVPLISILIVLALLFYFSKSCNQSKPSTATSTDSTAMLNSTTNAIIFIPIARAERCLI